MTNEITFFTAFIFGLLSFISPCVLPIVPGYISFISGVSLDEMKEHSSSGLKKMLMNSILFVLGFSLVFVLMGAGATTFGNFLLEQKSILSLVGGALIIIFGIHMTGLFRISALNYEKRFHMQNKSFGLFGSFLVGLAFAFGWTPCIGPILATILAIASQQESVNQGILLLSFYSLGLGIPFIITAISINLFFNFFNKVKKYFHLIEVIGGILLITVGILIMTNKLTIIASWLIKLFPFLSKLS
ncbi:MAG: cytochrome c biogenesis protein CcdA [Ignavibacteria bacterium]|nr:cytochrome c biogenesis protein CcdA [Ignavibacteria bacterium]